MNRHPSRLNLAGRKTSTALLLLGGLFVGSGCSQLDSVGSTGKRVVEYFSGKTPVNAAVSMENQQSPDRRREGINALSDRTFGRQGDYLTRYKQIAQLDNDYLVRATAIRALNRSRDASATALFVKALGDENPVVRVEACKALANVPDQAAIPGLLRILANPEENHDARIWAATAMKNFRTTEVARALIVQLNGRDFGVAWTARKSLVTLTGQDHRFDEAAWLQYLNVTEKPFG